VPELPGPRVKVHCTRIDQATALERLTTRLENRYSGRVFFNSRELSMVEEVAATLMTFRRLTVAMTAATTTMAISTTTTTTTTTTTVICLTVWLLCQSSQTLYRVFKKTAQIFTHDKFWTIRRKMKLFAPKSSAKINVYQSIQNVCKWVKWIKYSLLNSRKWLHVSMTVRCRTDRYTLAILQTNVPDQFIERSNWSNSPDLNPVDYSVWGAFQRLVYRQKFKDIDHLEQILCSCLDQPITSQQCCWPVVVRSQGEHIEHRFR